MLFEALGVSLPETSSSTVILLCTPLSAGHHLDVVHVGRKERITDAVVEKTGADAIK